MGSRFQYIYYPPNFNFKTKLPAIFIGRGGPQWITICIYSFRKKNGPTLHTEKSIKISMIKQKFRILPPIISYLFNSFMLHTELVS
jgi:hypothetical protein